VTVAELITILQTHDQDRLVIYSKWSEQCLLDPVDITTAELCAPRPDGWVQSARPDQPKVPYLFIS